MINPNKMLCHITDEIVSNPWEYDNDDLSEEDKLFNQYSEYTPNETRTFEQWLDNHVKDLSIESEEE